MTLFSDLTGNALPEDLPVFGVGKDIFQGHCFNKL